MATSRHSTSRFRKPSKRAHSRTGLPRLARRWALEALEDRLVLANTTPIVADPLDDLTIDQGETAITVDLSGAFRDIDAGDTLTYSVSSPLTVADVVARVREGEATVAGQEANESEVVDSLREILGTDSAPASTATAVYDGLLYAHSGNDRSTKGSEHDTARQNIVDFFKSLGYNTWLEQFEYYGRICYNIVAEKRGATTPSNVYVVGAHYDSYDIMGTSSLLGSPGADADASGVAAIMAMAYAVSPYHFDSTIRFVAFDRGEQNQAGSTAYVAAHTADAISAMVNLDRVGYNVSGASNNTVTFYDTNGLGTTKASLIAAFNDYHYGGAVTAIDGGRSTTRTSDHTPFEVGGSDGVLVTETGTNPTCQTSNDSLESRRIDHTYLTNITKGVTGYLCSVAGLLNRSDLCRASVSGSTLTLTFFTGEVGSDTCTVRATDSSGAWVEDTFTVTVRQTNQAPVLTATAPTIPTITEDQTNNHGVTVATIVGGSISDADTGAVQGIAISGSTSGRGVWQFSIDNGATWTDMEQYSENAALLLRAEDLVRFVPDGVDADTATLTYHAWDQTAPTRNLQGEVWHIGTPSVASPFSSATDTATLSVVAVNDAPVLNTSTTLAFAAIAEDTQGSGTLVSAFLASSSVPLITDVDGESLEGIAILAADNSFGTWQYSLDGNLWYNVGSVSSTAARLLAADATTRIRFVPAANFNMSAPGAVLPTITFCAWDRTTGANGNQANVNKSGGATAFSTATQTASLSVWEVNDAPVLIQGAVANLTVGAGWAATSLGLSGVTYSPGGGGDEVGQTLTYLVTAVPATSLGKVYLADGATQVVAGATYTLAQVRGMQFAPAAGVSSGSGTFRFTVVDNGTTNGVLDPKSLVQSLKITVASTEEMTTTVGMYDPTTSTFYLRYSNSSGNADLTFAYGDPSLQWTALVGDWDGDGVDGVGFFDPATSLWYLRDSLTTGIAEYTFGYGAPGANWTPLVGDWDGDGRETIGLFDPVNYIWYLRNSLTTGNADWAFGYGMPGANWTPIVGDWDGNQTDTIGFYDATTSIFYLRNSLSAGYANVTFGFGMPGSNWQPVVGDWDGNGTQTIGVYDPNTSDYYLRNSLTTGMAELAFGYGSPGWQPLTGRWGGSSAASAAVQAVAADQVYAAAVAAEGLSTALAADNELAHSLADIESDNSTALYTDLALQSLL
jgi:hypothetical protein